MNGVEMPLEDASQSVQPEISVQKRSMRRPYKSMSENNLISKKTTLQKKLAILKIRVNTWNDKVEKYDHELMQRTAADAPPTEVITILDE